MENTKNESNKKREEKPIYKKWWFWLLIVFAIAIIGSGSDSKKDAKKVGETSSSGTTNSVQKVEQKEQPKNDETNSKDENSEPTEFKVGDVISFKGKEVSVTNVKRNYNAGKYREAKSGKEFIKLAVKIENKSDSDISVNPYDFKIQDSNGTLNDHKWTIVEKDDNELESKTLVPGGKISGTLMFEVPKGDKNLKLIYKPTFSFSDKKVIINL